MEVPPHLGRVPAKLVGKKLLTVGHAGSASMQPLARSMRDWGMSVIAVSSAAEALAKMVGQDFDGLLLEEGFHTDQGIPLEEAIATLHGARIPPLLRLQSIGSSPPPHLALPISALVRKPIRVSVLYETLVDLLAAPDEMVSAHNVRTSDSRDTGPAASGSLSILLAEDNRINQRLAIAMLDRLGFDVHVVANGIRVLEALEQRDFDVILMDVQMPEMDGLETTRRIREHLSARRQPHIIGVTAEGHEGSIEHCLGAGMNDYMRKPFSIEALTAALEKATSQPSEHGMLVRRSVDRRARVE